MKVLITKPTESNINMNLASDSSLQSRVMHYATYNLPRCLANFTRYNKNGEAIFKTSKLYIGNKSFERAWRWAYRNLINN
jgi:hypothetical protein